MQVMKAGAMYRLSRLNQEAFFAGAGGDATGVLIDWLIQAP
jgi:hypothetical protein